MKKILSLVILASLCATTVWAQEAKSKELERVQAAEKVLRDTMQAPDRGIPDKILAGAQCVVIVPSMLNGGFIFGGRYGRGVSTCLTSEHGTTWSAPAPVRIYGGSFGLLAGGQTIDLVMLVMNRDGMEKLLSNKFKIGADVSGAAGPIGRQAEAATDWKMGSEVLTYSRARGVYAGVSLNGAVVKQDTDDTLALYGKSIPARQILTGKVAPPPGTRPFLAEVHRYFLVAKAPKNAGTTATARQNAARPGGETAPGGGMAGGVTGTEDPPDAASQSSALAAPPQTEAGGSSGESQTTTETSPSGSQPSASGEENMNRAVSSDDQVRAAIRDSLQNEPQLSSSNVNVSVTDTEVVLSGSVPNQTDKATIRRLAQQNANGRRVVDSELAVK